MLCSRSSSAGAARSHDAVVGTCVVTMFSYIQDVSSVALQSLIRVNRCWIKFPYADLHSLNILIYKRGGGSEPENRFTEPPPRFYRFYAGSAGIIRITALSSLAFSL